MTITRMQVKALMKAAYKRGQSASSFFRDMDVRGLTYRHTTMLADWRTAAGIEKKKGLARFIRKDRYPTPASIVVFETTKSIPEYMYAIKVKSVIHPDKPVTEQYVNIFSDVPMTPGMVEQAIVEKWAEWEDYTAIALEEPILHTVYRSIPI